MQGFAKTSTLLIVFALILVWTFAGWPKVWENPPIPPKIQEAQAADISIDTGTAGQWRGMRSVVFTSTSTGYFFYIDGGDADFKYVKTTDGGATWGGGAEIDDDLTITGMMFDVWYDRWTPGDNGDLIHIWWVETADGDVNYVNLNTTNDSIGSNVIVFNGASAVAGRVVFVSGAKARGGNMLVAFNIDAGAETGTYRSTDGGAVWGARTNMVEATIDQGFMFPGNETDTQDMWLLYHDASASALTLKVHDDSANTNSESATIASLVENTTDGTGQYGFSGSIRDSDNHLIAATHSAYDNAATDFQVWDINGTASITQKTAITTNIDDNYYPSVFINNNNDDIYVSYVGKRDGSETLNTTAGVYYTKSTDGGTNWTAGDTAYSATASDWRHTWAPLSGSRFMVVWRDISAGTLLTNFDNSVETPATPTNSAPTVSSVNISPSPITLTENGTTTVTITATVTDTDGCDDVFVNGTTTATLYRSGVGASCSADANNCYVNIPLTEVGDTCTGGADTTGDASGTVQVWYIAEATDASSTFSVQNWETTVKAIDAANASSTSTGTAELSTLLAINVGSTISYGTVNPNATSTTQTLTITNTGNFNSTDTNFSGVNLESGGNSITVGSQRYSTTTSEFWDYMDYTLSGTATFRELNIAKATATTSPSTQDHFWAIQVPNGTPAGTYTGTSTIEAQ